VDIPEASSPPADRPAAAAGTAARGAGDWRGYPLLLGLLLLAVGLSSGAIIVRDRRPLDRGALTNLVAAEALAEALADGTRDGWSRWLQASRRRPPLASPLYLPALLLVSNKAQAVRLTDLALFLLLLWQVYALGRALGSRRTGLLAAWLLATFPLVQGWCRAGNADPALWLGLLVLLRMLLALDLRDRRQALALGLCAGLCPGLRLLALVFLVVPALWIVAVAARDRRCLPNLALAGVAALLPAGWWFLTRLGQLGGGPLASVGQAPQQGASLMRYLQTGHLWMLAGALLAWLALWRGGTIPRRQLTALGLWIGAPALVLLLWRVNESHPLALVPACALLVALALEHIGPRRLRLTARVTLPALALVPLLLVYSAGISRLSSGLVWPDPRPHDAPLRVLQPVPAREPVLLVNETRHPDYARGTLLASGRRDLPRLVDRWRSGRPHALQPDTRVRYLLRVAPRCRRPGEAGCERFRKNAWWQAARVRLPLSSLALAHDPDGMEYELFRLPAPMTGRALATLRPPQSGAAAAGR
jgi:hypothetical protein